MIFLHYTKYFRIIVYAPQSKTWKWINLSSFITDNTAIFGDFNVDLFEDDALADELLSWADSHFLAPYTTDGPTSLRSNRNIDYAFTNWNNIGIQSYKGATKSDHKLIISIVPFSSNKSHKGKNTHWKVFSIFIEFTFSFWSKQINSLIDWTSYDEYVRFIALLSLRCTTYFDLNKYRSAIPPELRSFLSYIRAPSFRQLKLKCPHLRKTINSLRNVAKKELKFFFSNKLDLSLKYRNSSLPDANTFWFKCKNHLKPSTSSLRGIINSNGKLVNDPQEMCNITADFYESFFKKPDVVRPHPYVDAPQINFDDENEEITPITIDELLNTVHSIRKKKSFDAHGISSFMFKFIDQNHWSFLLPLFNHSFQTAFFPTNWKKSRMILLAKKDPICSSNSTRPISLIDCFQKVCEKLFLSRFQSILFRKGILPDYQSGFRERFRLYQ